MKKEITLAFKHANQDYNWENVKPSKHYETRLNRRRKRRKLDKDFQLNWRNDPGEKVLRIFEWQKARFVVDSDQTQFPCFRLALRLVVLSQMSSCAIERIFSSFKLIRDTCGDKMIEHMASIHILMKHNGDSNTQMCCDVEI